MDQKDVILSSGFCVAKGITEFKVRVFYAAALIKKQHYWSNIVTGDLIDTHFENKEVIYVGILEARTKDNKLFKVFFMKDPNYVMKIMSSWVTLDELEGARTRRDFIERSGTKDTKQSTYWQPIGIRFRYIPQVGNPQ